MSAMLRQDLFELVLSPILVLGIWSIVFINFRVWRRWDAPAPLLALVWACVSTLYLLASGSILFPISSTTMGYVFASLIAFSFGAMFAWREAKPGAQAEAIDDHERLVRTRILQGLVLFLIVTLPFYLRDAFQGVSLDEPALLLAELRRKGLDSAGETRSFSFIRNLSQISFVVALSLPFVATQSKRLWITRVVAILIAVMHGLSTGSKAVVPSIIIALLIISYGNNTVRRSVLKPVLTVFFGVALFLVAVRFTAMAYIEGSFIDLLPVLAEVFLLYVAAPLVALDQALSDPFSVSVIGQDPYRSVQFVINGVSNTFGLGGVENIPSLHASFLQTGPSVPDAVNTYTHLISYHLMGGPLVALLSVAFLGFLLGSLFCRIRLGLVSLHVYYSILAVGLVFSFGGEGFLMNAPNLIKGLFVCLTVNWLLPALFVRPVDRIPRNSLAL
jgi:oligosaccharide repeat unit polymerase